MKSITTDLLLQNAAKYFQEGNFEASLKACEQAINLNPSLAIARCNRGIVLKHLRRYDEALLAYDRSLKLNPSIAVTHYNRGLVLQDLNRLSDALSAYESAIELNAEYFEAYSAMGTVLKNLGHTDRSIQVLKKALEINPDQVNVKYLLASLGQAKTTPQESPHEYITGLFDNYANDFDEDLTEKLRYRVPEYLFEAVKKYIGTTQKKLDIVDLGCGTGLCGCLFKGFANKLIGVDLSSQMLVAAKKKNVFTKLIQDDICSTLKKF